MPVEILTRELADALNREKRMRMASLELVAKESGVSASTLSRISHAIGTPDLDNIVRLANWLGQPASRFIKNSTRESAAAIVYNQNESIPNIVREIINKDPLVPVENKQGFADLFEVAYRAFVPL